MRPQVRIYHIFRGKGTDVGTFTPQVFMDSAKSFLMIMVY